MATIFWVEDQAHWINKFSQTLGEVDLDGRANELRVYRFAEEAKQAIGRAAPDAPPDIAILDAKTLGKLGVDLR